MVGASAAGGRAREVRVSDDAFDDLPSREEELRESEERYRTLFEQAPIGLFVYDRALRITECNARFVQILCSSFDRLLGLDLRKIKDQRILPALQGALDGEPTFYEGPYATTTSGVSIVASMRVSPLRDASGDVVAGLGFVEDFTERMRAQTALRQSEQRLWLYMKSSPMAVIGLNADSEIVEWNDSATRIFGWTEAEALGQSASMLVPRESREEVAHVWRKLMARQGGQRSSNLNLTKDGRRIHCDWYNASIADASGEVVGIASLVADVTERQKAEEALRASEARFRALIERAPDAIVVLRDERLVYVNPAGVATLAYDDASELVGREITSLIHPDETARATLRLARLADGEAIPATEYRFIRKDGSLVDAEVVSMRLEYDGAPATVTMMRDITERVQLQARLLQTDRLVSVGTLAAGVAHEINNPLAYLLTNLDVVRQRRLGEVTGALERLAAQAESETTRAELERVLSRVQDALEMIDVAREGADRVRSIVRDLKTFSRADEDALRPVDVRRVLEASIQMAWNELRHRARLTRAYEEVPTVDASESRLGQVFLNLLVNAAQALPVGHAGEHEIAVSTERDADGRVVVSVRDTGPGIPPHLLRRVFDPFFTTKPVGVGTGLGLSICNGIVGSIGGRIEVESELGKGTTFRVILPPSVRERSDPVLPARAPRPVRRARVLVIDDDVSIGLSLRVALAEEHDVIVTASGREALELLRQDAAFDVILCDVMMPDMSGLEVYETLTSELPGVVGRIVFVTGGAFAPRLKEFLDRIPNPRLEKPFELDALRELLRGRVESGEPSPSR
jgi:PAS domain S-box-containing protein